MAATLAVESSGDGISGSGGGVSEDVWIGSRTANDGGRGGIGQTADGEGEGLGRAQAAPGRQDDVGHEPIDDETLC